MPSHLHGRFGGYKPRNPEERGLARRQNLAKRAEAARVAAWLDKHRACANGCGQPVAFWDNIHHALRFSGCCSADCEAVLQARERNT